MSSTFSQLLLVLHYGGPQSELAHHIAHYLRETLHYEGLIKVMQPSQGRWSAQDLRHIDKNMDLGGPLYLHNLLDSVDHDPSIGAGTVLSIWLFEETSGDARQETLSEILALVNQQIAVQFAYNPDIAGLQQMMIGFKGQLDSVNDSDVPVKFREATISSQGIKALSDDLFRLLRKVEIPVQVQANTEPDQVYEAVETVATATSFEPHIEDEAPPVPSPPDPPPPLPQAKATWDVKEPDDPYHPVPHEYMDAIDGIGTWKIVGSSVRGRGHAHDAKYREDSFAVDTIDCWNIIAVSDGAGSRKYSRIGSKYATAAAVRGIKAYAQEHNNVSADEMLAFMEEALYVGLQHAYHRLETYVAEEREVEINFHDLACTLLLTIYCEVDGRRFVGGFQVGDGLIMVAHNSQNMDDFLELTEADSADFGGGTTFLTSEPLEVWLERETVLHELSDAPWLLMAMTDGVSDDMVPYDRNVPRFLLPGIERAGVLTFEESLEEAANLLLMMISYEKKGSFDDRTLVVMFQHLPEGTAVALDTSVAKTVPAEHSDASSDAPPPPAHTPDTPTSIE